MIGIEEATTLSSRKHQDISTCSRTSKPDGRPRVYSTTNPGGIGHAWYRAKVIVPCQRDAETDTRFIAARGGDNRFNNPEYTRVLQNLTGWQKRAWFDGDWDIAAGQFFTTFRREVHVVGDVDGSGSGVSPQFLPPAIPQKHAGLTPLAVFDDTRAREWFAALDYGFTHYTVALLGSADGDGNVFVVDEHAERLRLPQRHAAAIKAMLPRHRIGNSRWPIANSRGETDYRRLEISDLKRFVAGADVFSKQSDGTTVAAQYAKLGIRLTCANTDRINGWAEILQRFGDVEAGIRPTLFIHQRCGRLLECLPALQHDPNRPEDVLKVDADEDGVGGDDAADACRYLVATKARSISQRKL